MLYSMRNVLRLWRRQKFLQNKRFTQVRATTGIETEPNVNKTDNSKDFPQLLQKFKDKITFNSYLENDKLKLGYYKYYMKTVKEAKAKIRKELREKSLPPLPISLQYYVDKDRLLQDEEATTNEEPDKEFQLPFGTSSKIDYYDDNNSVSPKCATSTNVSTDQEFDRSNINQWMTNYEYFDDTKITSEELEDGVETENEWLKQYGTPDPKIGVSRVPCGGCGAFLHCSDPAIPGYLPSEIFKGREVDELKTMECQRCHFLKEYNIALDVSVQPEEYEKLLQSIR